MLEDFIQAAHQQYDHGRVQCDYGCDHLQRQVAQSFYRTAMGHCVVSVNLVEVVQLCSNERSHQIMFGGHGGALPAFSGRVGVWGAGR